MSPIPAVLLRPSSRSCSTSSPDPYAYLLSQPPTQFPSKQPSYQPYFQPLFETAFDNESELEGIIWSGGEPWGGVVVTSQRAVEAWEKAARKVAEGGGKGKRRESSRDSGEDDLVDDSDPDWSSTLFFTIGPSTYSLLSSLSSPESPNPVPPNLAPHSALVKGDGAGSSDSSPEASTSGNTPALADLIIHHFASSAFAASRPGCDILPESRPLLYLTGDKNSPLLSQRLSAACPPISLESLQVYRTAVLPSFHDSLRSLLHNILPSPSSKTSSSPSSSSSSSRTPWIVLFSPSSIPPLFAVLESLPHPSWKGLVRLACIGPTTGDALSLRLAEEDAQEEVMVVAAKPTAGSLTEAMRKKDGLI